MLIQLTRQGGHSPHQPGTAGIAPPKPPHLSAMPPSPPTPLRPHTGKGQRPPWASPHGGVPTAGRASAAVLPFPEEGPGPGKLFPPPISPPRPVLLPLLLQWLWPGWSVRCWRTPAPFWAPAEPRRTHCTHRAAAAPIGPVHVLDSAQPGRKLWSPLTFPRAISSPLCPASVLIKPSLAPCK